MVWSGPRMQAPDRHHSRKGGHEMSSPLTASRCPRCGLLAVPPEPFGCERCGTPAAELSPAAVSSAGVVIGHAVVHEHARAEPPTPFMVVEVRLDDGPVVRSLQRGA